MGDLWFNNIVILPGVQSIPVYKDNQRKQDSTFCLANLIANGGHSRKFNLFLAGWLLLLVLSGRYSEEA